MSTSDFQPDTTESALSRLAMDRMYRHQRHIYDASRKFYLLGRDNLIRDLKPPRGGDVLEIGCGTGRNIVAAAQRYPLARFHGIDISGEMLKSAAVAVARAGLNGRIRLAQSDARTTEPGEVFQRSNFDRIFFSYTLSMIPQWRQALANAMQMLAPGGELHIVDFGQCEALPRIARGLLFRWLRLFDVHPCRELGPVLGTQADRHGAALTLTPRFGGYAWQAVIKVPASAPSR